MPRRLITLLRLVGRNIDSIAEFRLAVTEVRLVGMPDASSISEVRPVGGARLTCWKKDRYSVVGSHQLLERGRSIRGRNRRRGGGGAT